MQHEEIKSKLDEFYDHKLPVEQAETVRRHLASCSECRLQSQTWQRLSARFFPPQTTKVPDSFSNQVMGRIWESQKKPWFAMRHLFGLPKWEVAVAFSALFLILSYLSLENLPFGFSNSPTATAEEMLFSSDSLETEDLLAAALGSEEDSAL